MGFDWEVAGREAAAIKPSTAAIHVALRIMTTLPHLNYIASLVAHPFRQSLDDTKNDLAACVTHLTEFVGPPGIRKRQDGFNHGFQFPGIHKPSDFR